MCLLALLAVGLFAGSLIAADDKKGKVKDEEAIQGEWVFVSLDTGKGPPEARGELKKFRVAFKKDQAAIQFTDEEAEFHPFKLDPSAKPKALDLATGDPKQAMKMLYALDGDALVLCLHNGPGARTGRPSSRPTPTRASACSPSSG